MGVGIDVGSKTIKVVELEKNGAVWVLSGSGVVAYSGNQIEKIEDERELSQIAGVIKKIHREARINKRNVTISIPEALVFTRTIRFPYLTDAEIASAIKWEAEQYIPIPINEAVIQHTILERNDKSTPPEVVVLLVAAPIILVEKYIRLFQLAGLSVDSVETELISLVRSLAPEGQTVLLLDFGARSTDIAVSKNKNLVFSRSLSTAGDALTRTLSQKLQVDAVQAEQYKKSYGMSRSLLEGKVAQILSPTLNMVIDEIKKAIHFYQNDEKGDMPKSIIITGGSSGLIDLSSYISKQLGIEVEIGNPFSGIKVDPDAAKTLVNFSPLYAIACGLAEKGG